MSDLRDELSAARSMAILTAAAIHGAEKIADDLAVALVHQSKAIERCQLEHAAALARVALLEQAVATAQQQVPIAAAFHLLRIRARNLGEPTTASIEVAQS